MPTHGSLRSSSVVPASPSISSFSSSLSWVYLRWKKSELTRVHLRDLSAAIDVDKFYSGKSDLFVFPSSRSSLASRCPFSVLGPLLGPPVSASPVLGSAVVFLLVAADVVDFSLWSSRFLLLVGRLPRFFVPPRSWLRPCCSASRSCSCSSVLFLTLRRVFLHCLHKSQTKSCGAHRQVDEMGGVGSNSSELGRFRPKLNSPLWGNGARQSEDGPGSQAALQAFHEHSVLATSTPSAGDVAGVATTRSLRIRSPRSVQALLGTVCPRGSELFIGYCCRVSFAGQQVLVCLLRFWTKVRNQTPEGLWSCKSPAGTNFVDTPLVVPVRGWLDGIRRLMCGDFYVGRGSTQRGLKRSEFCNDYLMSVNYRQEAIWRFEQKLKSDQELSESLCTPTQDCHADAIIREFRSLYPGAHDRGDVSTGPPSSRVLNFLARLREEAPSEEGSSADENVPAKGAGWRGQGDPMMVGVGYTAREFCDGQSLASPGRWPVHLRRYPDSKPWQEVSELFMSCAEREGQLLTDLTLGKVKECPFSGQSIQDLKESSLAALSRQGLSLQRTAEDRGDVPTDFRYIHLLLTASEDPEVSLGSFASGVRVGPGARLPRLPALYAPKKWPLTEQSDPVRYQEERVSTEQVWRRNYSTPVEFKNQVLEVMEDQAKRGQVLKLSESEARAKFPNLVAASLGAQRKEKPRGVVTARVLFDGTHGIDVNTSTRIRDQERSPIAADLKRAMQKKSQLEEKTFALPADVSEAPSSPHCPSRLASAWLSGSRWFVRVRQHGNFRNRVRLVLLVSNSSRPGTTQPVLRRSLRSHLAHARGR